MKLSTTEAVAWAYLEQQPEAVIEQNINQLAEAAFVSPASIVRALKKKG